MDNNYAGGAALGIISLIYVAIILLLIVSFWKIFTKAGKPGWASIIPIYNIIVMLEIVKRPIWWLILMLIPIVNIVIGIILWVDLIKVFGKPGWHVILAIFFPFIYFPYLAFSDASYTP